MHQGTAGEPEPILVHVEPVLTGQEIPNLHQSHDIIIIGANEVSASIDQSTSHNQNDEQRETERTDCKGR